ncbi:hypothetical protein [Bradyrhizobium stylosanthis]|uniref:Uncharacterized protein n=1 Tax=Bradyrhizobium stylosanthis TaxID=1803665 RepID=A0A560CX06_9BRAD|nr:hypothetical protein [Bradyrhizobium stylosanthis]TWA89394.1 hypothetical protein FBZ96_1208 [Bradyrhizobium stylosanthis]
MAFKFDDTASYADNTTAFSLELAAADPILGPVLSARLEELSGGADNDDILDELLAALTTAAGGS